MYNNNNDDNYQYQKFPGNKFFGRSQLTVFENKPTLLKKAILPTTTLMHCKARQDSCDLFIINQGNG